MREVLRYSCPRGGAVTLRPASPADAPAIIAAVKSRSDERSYVLMEVYGKDVDALRGEIEALDRDRSLFLVAVEGETVVGNLAARPSDRCGAPEPAAAVGLHLVPEWRGRGVGSAMLRYALRWARRQGYRRVEADIFTASRRSVGLFRKSGFRETPCRSAAVRVGARAIEEVLLVKHLR